MDRQEIKQEIQIIEREISVYEVIHEKLLRLLHCEVDQMIVHISRVSELEATDDVEAIDRISDAVKRSQGRITWLLETLGILDQLQEGTE